MTGAAQTRRWRTLVVIRTIDVRRGRFYVELPGWIHDFPLSLDLSVLTEEQLTRALRDGGRLFARVNTGAENPEDLVFSGWENPVTSVDQEGEREQAQAGCDTGRPVGAGGDDPRDDRGYEEKDDSEEHEHAVQPVNRDTGS